MCEENYINHKEQTRFLSLFTNCAMMSFNAGKEYVLDIIERESSWDVKQEQENGSKNNKTR